MNAPIAALIGSRLHLQHGPIDLIIAAESNDAERRLRAFELAVARFDTVLTELVEELPQLRSEVVIGYAVPDGLIAKRMHAAVRPHAAGAFVTCMAAVAGAVADEVLSAMVSEMNLTRAYVNNGGDIALHLASSHTFSAAIAGLDCTNLGEIDIPSESGVRGIATSGQGGRSFSFGIADSVTVLASTAAEADVAATLIANAINLPEHAHVMRTPANQLQPDSDLGEREVVTHVGELSESEILCALHEGKSAADRMLEEGQIIAASLSLRSHQNLVGRNTAWLSKIH